MAATAATTHPMAHQPGVHANLHGNAGASVQVDLWPELPPLAQPPAPLQPLHASAARRNWIAVACATHALRGCATPHAGFMQVCHGKAAPLRRVQAGDRVVYYAPTVTMGGSDTLQAFVSIGTVLPGEPYAFDMGGGFVPFRKNVAYVPARQAPIRPLLAQLQWARGPGSWGSALRFGLLAISDDDMGLIAAAMGADAQALGWGPAPT